MARPTTKSIRLEILHEDNIAVLNDDYVQLKLNDADAQLSTDDELAWRYFTCYLIAMGWESISAVQSREGVAYRAPNPSYFQKLFQDRINFLRAQQSSKNVAVAIFPINKDVTRDTTTRYLRRRQSGDPYYP